MPSLAPPPTANYSGSCFSKAEHFQRMLKELKKALKPALVLVVGVPESVVESDHASKRR